MQSNWMINSSLHKSVIDSYNELASFGTSKGVDKLPKTKLHKHIKKIHPEIYRVPLFRRQFCKMLLDEIESMKDHIGFTPNPDEDELRQIPEIVLKEHVPEIYRNMWFIVHTVLNPIFLAIWQRQVSHAASIQIANYNLKDKQQGNWHHDESADISVVVPLNTGDYKGGGTEFHNYGTVDPLPSGHALIFPSFTHMHRGLPVESGDRYLLVFWLYSRSRVQDLYLDGPTILNHQG
jgi:hypothetical protein